MTRKVESLKSRRIWSQSAMGLLALGGLWSLANAQMMDKMGADKANSIISSWPMDTQKAAKKVIAKYGAPDEATPSMLVWYNNGPWKRTVASRTPTMHHFPAPHPDSVEMVIDYRIPLSKYDDLAMYDGSVNVDRTKGELSARCDLEEMNFLALNLAHDIVTGKKSVPQARSFYGRVVKMFKEKGTVHPYQMHLMFTPAKGKAADPDKTIVMPKMG